MPTVAFWCRCLEAMVGIHDRPRGAVRVSAACRVRLTVVLLQWGLFTAGDAGSPLGVPVIESVSGHCAAIEFKPGGAGQVDEVYVFAKRPHDSDFMLWGSPLPVRPVKSPLGEGEHLTKYRVLMRSLPAGQKFQVRVGTRNDLNIEGSASDASEMGTTSAAAMDPPEPHDMRIHRTDPRKNLKMHDESVCVDIHWSHEHPRLDFHPNDVYFRITHQYLGEAEEKFCEDEHGSISRSCGIPIDMVSSALPASYATVCGLRPDRHVRFSIEVFNCDGRSVMRHLESVTPPSAPSVVTTLVTVPGAEEAIAGFRPTAVLDWIPQHDDRIEGHAIYLGLREVSAVKLLCWVPRGHAAYAAGHLDIPIRHVNHTFSEDSALLRDYAARFHVHQEQEIWVGTRVRGQLESPTYTFRLGEWLVIDEALKCLTSFEAESPSYVSRPIVLSWTQEEAMSLYD